MKFVQKNITFICIDREITSLLEKGLSGDF